ncbi:hypothetical protein N9174_02110 [bacterium]|nr:hypothetical protein [bacterium]
MPRRNGNKKFRGNHANHARRRCGGKMARRLRKIVMYNTNVASIGLIESLNGNGIRAEILKVA